MGRITTPKYRVEYRDNLVAMGKSRADIAGVNGKPCLTMAWRGKPSQAALEDWRKGYNESFKAGGCNAHISKAFNAVPHIFYAAIVRQADRKVMATVNAPTFEVA